MADWLCPHTPDVCEYAETCATKLAAKLFEREKRLSESGLGLQHDYEEVVRENAALKLAFGRAARKICRMCRDGVLLCGPLGQYRHETTGPDRCKAEAIYLERDMALLQIKKHTPTECGHKYKGSGPACVRSPDHAGKHRSMKIPGID